MYSLFIVIPQINFSTLIYLYFQKNMQNVSEIFQHLAKQHCSS